MKILFDIKVKILSSQIYKKEKIFKKEYTVHPL